MLELVSREGAMTPLIGAATCAVIGGIFLTFLIKVGFG